MGKSIFKEQKKFDKDSWVVSMFNAGAAASGHAALLVEGEALDGQLLIYRCEIFARSFPSYLRWFMSEPGKAEDAPDFSPQFDALYAKNKAIIDAMGETTVCYVTSKEYFDYPKPKRGKDLPDCTATNWAVSRPKVEKMLREIDREKQSIEGNTLIAIKQIREGKTPDVEKLFTLFKMYGNSSSLAEGEGINCVNWCEGKLPFADIKPVSNSSDSLAAKPEDHAAQRSYMKPKGFK